MKSASRFLSVLTLALAAGTIVSCARTTSVADYPSQSEIPARQIYATHTLKQGYMPMSSQIDVVVHFDTNSDKLSPKAESEIEQVASIISSPSFAGSHVTVEGYTDAVGKPAKNVKLSYHRALMVVHALVEHFGIPSSMLSAQGFGAANPVATNSTAAGRAANRRVTFAVSSAK